MQRLQFNTVASGCMKLLNTLQKLATIEASCAAESHLECSHAKIKSRLIYKGMSILLRVLNPIAPHITTYLWRQLGFMNLMSMIKCGWPKIVNSALKCDRLEYVLQVNGKIRSKMTVDMDLDKDAVEKMALADEKIQGYLKGYTIRKMIVVPNKLVNI